MVFDEQNNYLLYVLKNNWNGQSGSLNFFFFRIVVF